MRFHCISFLYPPYISINKRSSTLFRSASFPLVSIISFTSVLSGFPLLSAWVGCSHIEEHLYSNSGHEGDSLNEPRINLALHPGIAIGGTIAK